MDTVILKTFDSSILAHIASDRLTMAGIENYIHDENTNTIMPVWGMAIGGIKIVVKKEDEKKAQDAMFEIEDSYRRSAVCEKCGAQEIILVPKKSTGNFLMSLLTWLFSNYSVSAENVYHCKACGNETDKLPDPPEELENKDLL